MTFIALLLMATLSASAQAGNTKKTKQWFQPKKAAGPCFDTTAPVSGLPMAVPEREMAGFRDIIGPMVSSAKPTPTASDASLSIERGTTSASVTPAENKLATDLATEVGRYLNARKQIPAALVRNSDASFTQIITNYLEKSATVSPRALTVELEKLNATNSRSGIGLSAINTGSSIAVGPEISWALQKLSSSVPGMAPRLSVKFMQSLPVATTPVSRDQTAGTIQTVQIEVNPGSNGGPNVIATYATCKSDAGKSCIFGEQQGLAFSVANQARTATTSAEIYRTTASNNGGGPNRSQGGGVGFTLQRTIPFSTGGR